MTQKFDREFKLSAIRMASEADSTAVEVEDRLGISRGIISRWKKQLRDSGVEAFPGTGHVSEQPQCVLQHHQRDVIVRGRPSDLRQGRPSVRGPIWIYLPYGTGVVSRNEEMPPIPVAYFQSPSILRSIHRLCQPI